MTSATLTGQCGSLSLGDNTASNEISPAPAGSDEHSDLLVRPLPLHHERVPFAVAWTPKAGCTSLVKWFLFQSGDLEKALQYDKWIHRYRVKVFQRRDGYKTELLELVANRRKPVLKLVRNPYDRAVSSFLHVLDAMAEYRLKRGRRLPLVAAAMFNDAEFGTAISFRRFLETLKSVDLRHNGINPHINPQYRRGEESILARIIKLESFAAEIRSLESEFALAQAPVELITHSAHHRRKQDGQCMNLADKVFEPGTISHDETPAYSAFYDEATRGLVGDLYRDDFANYGYPP
jgi:Sulfotransferase family